MCTGPALFRWEFLIAVRAESAHRQQSGRRRSGLSARNQNQAHATTALAPGSGLRPLFSRTAPRWRIIARLACTPRVAHARLRVAQVREIARRANAERRRGENLAELLRCLHCADERGGVDDVKRAFGPELPAEGIGDARRVLVPAPRERGVKPLRIRFPALVPPDARHLVFTSPMGRGHEHGPRKKVYTKCCEW